MIKIKYEIERQPMKNLWEEARNSEEPSIDSKNGDAFKKYLNILASQAFKAGRDFQKNLKDDDVNYG